MEDGDLKSHLCDKELFATHAEWLKSAIMYHLSTVHAHSVNMCQRTVVVVLVVWSLVKGKGGRVVDDAPWYRKNPNAWGHFGFQSSIQWRMRDHTPKITTFNNHEARRMGQSVSDPSEPTAAPSWIWLSASSSSGNMKLQQIRIGLTTCCILSSFQWSIPYHSTLASHVYLSFCLGGPTCIWS